MACTCCGNTQTTKAADGKHNICPNCGHFYPVDSQVNMIYGTRYNDRACGLDIAVTERYFMVHLVPGQKGAKAAFGLVGWMVSVGMDNMETWGYYDRNEFRAIIFPYRNKKLPDDYAMKFIRWDGSDFILRGQFGTSLAKTADSLKQAGYPVVDGTGRFFGDTYCEKPFLTEKTLGARICPSAASFARQGKGTFIAEACLGAGQTASPRPAPQPVPAAPAPAAYTPAAPAPTAAAQAAPVRASSVQASSSSEYQKFEKESLWKKEDFSKESTVPISAPVRAAAPQSAPAESAPAESWKFCHECGNKLRESDKFCVNCGARQR